MDLIELRQALRRGWRIGLLVAILVGAIAVLALGPADTRASASTTVLVTPRAERFETVSTGVLRIILPNVLVVARSDDLRTEAAEEVGASASVPIEADASFLQESGVLTLTVTSRNPHAAATWSVALADALTERYDRDEYLRVEVLDRALAATPPSGTRRVVDLVAAGMLALFAGVLTVFALQRLRESGDVVARIRSGGVRVVGELTVPGRRSRPVFRGDEQARRLALAVCSGPNVPHDTRFVVVSADTRPAMAVVDALRAGLEGVGYDDRYKVALGPPLGDVAALHREAYEAGAVVVVLDRTQRIDEFVRDTRMVVDGGIPVVGAVVVRRSLLDRRRPRDEVSSKPAKPKQRRAKAEVSV